MNRIVQELTEILNRKALINKSPPLRITESNPNSKCHYIEFKGIKGKYVVFKLDDPQVGRVSDYLNPDNTDINKFCDAIIYVSVNKRKYIFLIELKSESSSGIAKAKKQLLNSELFVNYLNAIIEHHGKISTDDIEKRYFIFSTRPLAKKATDNKKKIKPRCVDGKKIYHCRCNQTVYIGSFDLS